MTGYPPRQRAALDQLAADLNSRVRLDLDLDGVREDIDARARLLGQSLLGLTADARQAHAARLVVALAGVGSHVRDLLADLKES